MGGDRLIGADSVMGHGGTLKEDACLTMVPLLSASITSCSLPQAEPATNKAAPPCPCRRPCAALT